MNIVRKTLALVVVALFAVVSNALAQTIMMANKPISAEDQKRIEALLSKMDPSTYSVKLASADGKNSRVVGSAKLDMSRVSQSTSVKLNGTGKAALPPTDCILTHKNQMPNTAEARELQAIMSKYK